MNGFIREEWKWIIGMVVSAFLFYGTLKTTIQDTKEMKPQVAELQKKQAVQEEINQTFKEMLLRMDGKMDRLLRK